MFTTILLEKFNEIVSTSLRAPSTSPSQATGNPSVRHRHEFGGLCHVVLPLLGSAGLYLLVLTNNALYAYSYYCSWCRVKHFSNKPQQFLDNLIVFALPCLNGSVIFQVSQVSNAVIPQPYFYFCSGKFPVLQSYSVVSPVILLCSVTFWCSHHCW